MTPRASSSFSQGLNQQEYQGESEVETSTSEVGNALPGVPNRDSSAAQASTEQPVPLVASSGDATVSTATPLPVQAERVALRRRFQKGTVIIRGKKPTRCGIYREDVLQANGTFKRVQRCVVLGPLSSLSERAAWKLFQPYLDRVNAAGKLPPKSGMTLEAFVRESRSSVAVNLKGSTTRAAESHLRRSAPLITSRLAKVWRRQCHVKFSILAASTAASNQ